MWIAWSITALQELNKRKTTPVSSVVFLLLIKLSFSLIEVEQFLKRPVLIHVHQIFIVVYNSPSNFCCFPFNLFVPTNFSISSLGKNPSNFHHFSNCHQIFILFLLSSTPSIFLLFYYYLQPHQFFVVVSLFLCYFLKRFNGSKFNAWKKG